MRVHISEEKKKKKKWFFFEEDKSPVHKEMINICMTEQMTAYFHGNALVSPEMSAGDRSRLLWASVWLLTESPALLDCRSQNTSKLEREREFAQVIVSALMWTRCHCFFFYCSQGKRALFICTFKEAVFSSVCRVCVVVPMNMSHSQKKENKLLCDSLRSPWVSFRKTTRSLFAISRTKEFMSWIFAKFSFFFSPFIFFN